MAERIIDLRNNKTEEAPRVPEKTDSPISWSAQEYEFHQRSKHWWLWAGGAALLFVVFGIISRSYLFIAFVLLAYGVLLLFARRPPQPISCAITHEGVRAGRKFYPFRELKSFWIFNAPEVKELSLETKKPLSPYVRVPLGNTDIGSIRHMLRGFLAEEEHKEFISDQLARKI